MNWISGPGRRPKTSPKAVVLTEPSSLLPTDPRGVISEEAKLRLRGTCRQPGAHEMASDPFAKSNNFGIFARLSGNGQG